MFVVSTPIGNLADLTYRATEVLKSVAAILAEDTRHTRYLLQHYDIATPMLAYHEHNEAKMVPRVLARLEAGKDLALVTDAGTPLISDPGSRLVEAVVARGFAVVPVPGASGVLAALVGAGWELAQFTFFGFLPRTGRARNDTLDAIVATTHSVAIYEAPSRVGPTLRALSERGAADRPAVVARELTKKFEEFARGTVAELAATYADSAPRGEVVLLLGPVEARLPDPAELREIAEELKQQGMSARDVARILVERHGATRNAAYELAHGR